jgi:tryptophan synthase alpha chain
LKLLTAYITAGFPDASFSVDLALSMKSAGADILELGVPFSDPMADGPIIEEANLLALQNGFKTPIIFDITRQISREITTYWMGYFNPFHHKGMDYFAARALECGASGFIIPDLPYEEAAPYKKLLEGMGLNLVSFVAPTDGRERAQLIVREAKGFIYLVAYAGITGSGKDEDLRPIIDDIKAANADTPLFVGFGVNEKTAREKARHADGVIVGSAFVKVLLDESLTKTQKIAKIADLTRTIKSMINE